MRFVCLCKCICFYESDRGSTESNDTKKNNEIINWLMQITNKICEIFTINHLRSFLLNEINVFTVIWSFGIFNLQLVSLKNQQKFLNNSSIFIRRQRQRERDLKWSLHTGCTAMIQTNHCGSLNSIQIIFVYYNFYCA